MGLAITKGARKAIRNFRKLADRDAIDRALEKLADDPRHPGLQVERLQRDSASPLWSARVSRGIRLILAREGETWVVLHVGKHDEAYSWAARVGRVGTNPRTGAFEIVHVREVYEERVVTPSAGEAGAEPSLFAGVTDEELLGLGLPREALPAVRRLWREEDLVRLIDVVPDAVWDRLVAVARGEKPVPLPSPPAARSPLQHPDTRRDLVVITGDEELERVLRADWTEWLTFLHPDQARAAYGQYSGPLKVTGPPGTGKTVVAMHRAANLAGQGRRVLVTTYSMTLVNSLRANLSLLCSPLVVNRVTVATVYGAARQVLASIGEQPAEIKEEEELARLFDPDLVDASGLPLECLLAEWKEMVDARDLSRRDEYLAVRRVGRGRPLGRDARKKAWPVFAAVRQRLAAGGMVTLAGLCAAARRAIEAGRARAEWDAVVVDELQDMGIQELRFLRAIAGDRRDGLTLAGDRRQRIYPGGATLRELEIDTRGRSIVLKVDYRTTLEIRRFAEKVRRGATVDGKRDRRAGRTVSMFRGPRPVVHRVDGPGDQAVQAAEWIVGCLERGMEPGSIAVFSRTRKGLDPVDECLRGKGIRTIRLRDDLDLGDMSLVGLGTMHRAKGLEFRAVLLLDVIAEKLPHHRAVNGLRGGERQVALALERNLLFVAATRARDELHVFWYGTPSPFLVEAGLVGHGPPLEA